MSNQYEKGLIVVCDDSSEIKKDVLSVVDDLNCGYTQVNLKKALSLSEWQELTLKIEDIVLLDICFRLEDIDFSGRDVFRNLVEWKKNGHLRGLSRVLINTTLKSEIDQPYILNALPYTQGGFDVYAMEIPSLRSSIGYHPETYKTLLFNKIMDIYRGKEIPINSRRSVRR
ncbi:hypothetical protein J4216_05660 [Candidatus Woesearchaeota archaeon]|nr:hypothetical protein [Candidatus Woesearchaeota archaeon]